MRYAVGFQGLLRAVVDSITEGLEVIVTVLKIWYKCFEALRSWKWFFNEGNRILLRVFIRYKTQLVYILEIMHFNADCK